MGLKPNGSAKVWRIDIGEKYSKAQISTSRKKNDELEVIVSWLIANAGAIYTIARV